MLISLLGTINNQGSILLILQYSRSFKTNKRFRDSNSNNRLETSSDKDSLQLLILNRFSNRNNNALLSAILKTTKIHSSKKKETFQRMPISINSNSVSNNSNSNNSSSYTSPLLPTKSTILRCYSKPVTSIYHQTLYSKPLPSVCKM